MTAAICFSLYWVEANLPSQLAKPTTATLSYLIGWYFYLVETTCCDNFIDETKLLNTSSLVSFFVGRWVDMQRMLSHVCYSSLCLRLCLCQRPRFAAHGDGMSVADDERHTHGKYRIEFDMLVHRWRTTGWSFHLRSALLLRRIGASTHLPLNLGCHQRFSCVGFKLVHCSVVEQPIRIHIRWSQALRIQC